MVAQFIYSFIFSLITTAICIPPTIFLAKKFRLVDDPKTHKHPAILHKKPIPRAGGLPIFIGIVLSSVFFLPHNQTFASILVAGAIVVMVGLLDDRFDLSPYLRFLTNIFAAAFVVFQGLTLPFITNPFGGILHFEKFLPSAPFLSLPAILAIIWIVWVMNMLNWSKGVDGQMPGIAAVAAVIIGIASLRLNPHDALNIHTATMSFIVAGASIGFLLFNFYPAKIFPGYSATILGFTIAVLSILSSVKLATAVLVLGVPTADAAFTVIRRILSKRSPFRHDRGHLHHHLLDIGWGHRRIALFYWVVSVLLGLIALALNSKGKLFAIILVSVIVSGVILTFKFMIKDNKMTEEK